MKLSGLFVVWLGDSCFDRDSLFLLVIALFFVDFAAGNLPGVDLDVVELNFGEFGVVLSLVHEELPVWGDFLALI